MAGKTRGRVLANRFGVHGDVRLRYYGHADVLSQCRVAFGKRYTLLNRWMIEKVGLDFCGCDVFSASVDHFLATAGQEQIALRIQLAQIPCAEPAVHKDGFGFGFAKIVREDAGSLEPDLSALTRRATLPIGIENTDIQGQGFADRARSGLAIGDAGDLQGFGHPIGLKQRYPECFADLCRQRRAEGGRAASDEPQWGVVQGFF